MQIKLKPKALIVTLLLLGLFTSPALAARQKLTVKGSTTVLPIAQVAAEVMMDRAADLDISVQGGGSGLGIAALIDKTTDIALSSRAIKPAELARARGARPVATVIAHDGIAVIVHPSNPIKGLSLSQLQAIYTGQITDWSSLGGPKRKIVVISRDSSSGTFEAFEDLALKKRKVKPGALSAASNQAIAKTVAQTPGAIGYLGLGYLSPRVKALSIDGQTCTRRNIQNRHYALARPLYLYTSGQPTGRAKLFVDFILSAEGQRLVTEEGFVGARR